MTARKELFMRTGIECNYGVGLECKVVLDKETDAETYAKEIETALKEAEPLYNNVKEKFSVYVIAKNAGKNTQTVTIGVNYDLTDYPDYYEGCPQSYDSPAEEPEFDYVDGEETADRMTKKVFDVFSEKRVYKNFEYKEVSREYDTEEDLFQKLEDKRAFDYELECERAGW
jgi:hypothetical protein